MQNLGLGLQLYSVREELAHNEWETIRLVAEMGYRQVELCAPDFENGRPAPRMAVSEIKKRYADLNLRMLSIAMPVNFHRDIEDWKQLADYSNRIGCEAICCSVATFSDKEDVLRHAAFFNQVGKFAAEQGQKFFYHNHYHEFQRFHGEAILDLLVENTDPTYVDFELDTFWALRGGIEPVSYMEKLGERLKLVHQKNLAEDVQPVNLFEVIPENMNIDWDGFVKYANTPEAFRELNRGVINVRAIVEKAKKMPSVYSIIVEQDHSQIGELRSAKENYNYLKTLI